MNRTLTTGRIVISGAFALSVALGSAGTAMATGHDGATQPTKQSSAKQDPAKKQDQAKQTTPHAEEADGSDHGATGKPAKDDPNPGKGKDCVQHGNHGGVNEDHCGPADRPDGPGTETPTPSEPKPETPKPESPQPETPKPGDTTPETPKPGDTTPETPKPEDRSSSPSAVRTTTRSRSPTPRASSGSPASGATAPWWSRRSRPTGTPSRPAT